MRRRELLLALGATGVTTGLACAGWPDPLQGPASADARPARRSPSPPPNDPSARAIPGTDWATGLNDLRGVDDRDNARRAALYVPSSYDEAVSLPLMIGFHGNGGDGRTMFKQNALAKLCEERGFVGLFPNMLNGAVQEDGSVIDPAVLEQDWSIGLVDKTAKRLNIDRSRVWLVGFSMGGRRAYRLAAIHSETIAAIAVSGSRMGYDARQGADDRWRPEVSQPKPVSVLHIHGEKDTRVPINGDRPDMPPGVRGIPTEEGLELWASHLRATEQPMTRAPQPCPARVRARRWQAESGHRVMGLFDPSLGHEWAAPWANPVIADFLQNSPPRT